MTRCAPVALFAWRRPNHLLRVLESLVANPEAPETDVVAFCDGPRDESHREDVEAVERTLTGFRGFRSLRVVRRDTNWGLSRNVISGATEIVNLHGRVIVLEDDLVVSPAFLGWMNRGLERYAEDARVASIHGYVYPVESELPDAFFLRGADCWGWATWKRAWDGFEPDGAALETRLRERGLESAFDWNGAFGYMGMLRSQIEGRNDSWAVRWHASMFLADKLTLYPGHSLVANIGHDASGTHSARTDEYDVRLSPSAPGNWPEPTGETKAAIRPIREFLWKTSGTKRPLLDKLLTRMGLR